MKISVVIPAYRSSYLKMAIDSVLSQTYPDWELIIVDDCSPDDIHSIVSSYSDPRIHYWRNDHNFGAVNLVANWNNGLTYCTGDYMLCMGDDDALPCDSLAAYVGVIKSTPGVNVVHGWTNIIDSDSHVTDILQQHPSYESVFGFMLRTWKGDDFFAGDILYNVQTLRNIGGFVDMPLAWHSDHLTAYLCAGSKGIASTQQLAFSYRRHSATISMSSGSMSQKLRADYETLSWVQSFLSGLTPQTDEERIQKQSAEAFLPHIFEVSLSRTLSECNRRKPMSAIAAFMRLPKRDRSLKLLLRTLANVYA